MRPFLREAQALALEVRGRGQPVISLVHPPQAKPFSSRSLHSGCFGELGSVSLKPRPVF